VDNLGALHASAFNDGKFLALANTDAKNRRHTHSPGGQKVDLNVGLCD